MTQRIGHGILLLITALVPAAVSAQRSASAAAITTERILAAVGAGEGATVCEIGAGDGALSLAAARLVGGGGRVFTTELGESRVKRLQDEVARSGVAHVTVVAGAEDRANLPEAACDAVILRDVYHHLTNPAAMNQSMLAALKPGGRLAVIDFTPPGGEAPTPADRGKDGMHGVRPPTVTRELEQAGFQSVAAETPSERWFMVVVRKPEK